MTLTLRIGHFSPEHEKLVDKFVEHLKEEIKMAGDNPPIDDDDDIYKDNPKKDHQVVIPDDKYDLWTAQISKLKSKKQKLWKDNLVDKWGCKTKVRYEDGEFWNYCAVGSRMEGEKGKKCKVLPQSQQVINTINDGGKVYSGSVIGAALIVAAKMKNIMKPMLDKHHYMLFSKLIDDIYQDVSNSIKQDNMTGNHYRNHIVNVSGNLYGH